MNRIKTQLILAFCMLCIGMLQAQHPLSAKVLAMGESGVAMQDINSIFYNQAGLMGLEDIGLIVSAENRFSLQALGTYSAGLAYPLKGKGGTLGLSMNYFGFEAFKRQKIGLIYARNLLPNLSVGAEVNFHNFQIADYGNQGIASFELGLQYKPSKTIVIGVQLSNPVEQELADGDNLQTRFRLGGAYLPSEKLNIHASLEKELDTAIQFRVGFDYQLISILHVRVGISTEPALVSGGLGIHLKNGLQLDASFNYHQQLGLSPSIGVVYQRTRIEEEEEDSDNIDLE